MTDNKLKQQEVSEQAAPQLEPASMTVAQEPKYGIRDGRLLNRASGEFIPADEPVFIFRARDVHAVNVLADYARNVSDADHAKAVWARVEDFKRFWNEHPDRMKQPDTAASHPQAVQPKKCAECNGDGWDKGAHPTIRMCRACNGTGKLLPDALRRLGEYLARVLDEDQWVIAEQMLIDSVAQAAPSVPDGWRCFHCGEAFTDQEQAALHFGTKQQHEPVCQVSAERLRELERDLERYHEEDTDLHRQIYGMQAQHHTALQREEEKGYARGLRDAAIAAIAAQSKEPKGASE